MTVTDLADQAAERAARAAELGRVLVTETEALKADYARVLLREVPCYESVFRGVDGAMGRVDPALLALYRRHDFVVDDGWRVGAADQLGVQLCFAAHLCERERDGWAKDRPDEATVAVEAQRELLAAHVGVWGPVAAEALLRTGSGYAEVGAQLARWLADESALLRPAPDHPGMPAVEPGPAPDAGSPARIARHLLTPERAGGFLAAADIAPLARALHHPWRPSDGRSRLREVVVAADEAGRLRVVGEALAPLVAGWARRWQAERDRQPGAARIFEGWWLRAAATAGWLHTLDQTRHSGPRVVVVPDHAHLAAEVARLSASGLVVTVHPAPREVLAEADVVVRLDGRDAETIEG